VAFDRSRYGGGDIRGILGQPLFRDHLLTVDYGEGRLEISDAKLPEKGPGIVPFSGEHLPEISMWVGGEELSCHIDSGSPSGIMLPASVVEGLPHKTEPKVVGHARTVNTSFDVWSVQLDGTITVAGNEFVDPVVGYNEILPNGLIGYQILKDLVLSIDQRSKRVRLVPPAVAVVAAVDSTVTGAGGAHRAARDARSAERRRLGVAIAIRGEQLAVDRVMEGSAAQKAGMQAGDVLIEIAGKPATQARMQQALGGQGPIVIKLERAGKSVEITLFE
jgi:hypothetical protein